MIKPILRFLYNKILIFKYSKYWMFFQDNFNYTDREKVYREAMKYVAVSKVEGHYYEFGVFHGNTMITAYHFAQRHGLKDMLFVGFDSFEGLPEIKTVDAAGFKHFKKGEFTCTIDQTRKIMRARGVDLTKVDLVPGWFDRSLPEYEKNHNDKIAVAMIDCDLYESTVPCLNFLTNKLQDGSILIFDDWYCFRGDKARGEQRAVDEWLEKNPNIMITKLFRYNWNGIAFLVNKND